MPWAIGAALVFRRLLVHFTLGVKARRTARPTRVTSFLCAALYAVFVLSQSVEAQERPTRRVLILNETGTSYPAINVIDQGIRAGLQDAPYRLEFYREYMETVLFPDPESQQEFRTFYLRKYQNRKPDLIITVGPSPLQFMLETHDRAFAGVPVIFCLPYGPLPGDLKLDSGITGVASAVEPAATLEVALRLKPETKKVILVGGTSILDKQTEAMVQRGLSSYAGRLEISLLTNLTMPALLERLKHVPGDSIILFSGITQDAAGTPFSGNESAPAVTAAATAPVFVLTDSFLGHGEVGGKLFTRFEQGKVIGNISLRVLNGEKPQDIPAVNGVTQYMFDRHALKRWGFRERDLPPDSIVLNRQPSFWESYKKYIVAALIALLLQTAAIIALLWQRAVRRKTQAALRKSEEKFAKAFQRSPLAFTLVSLVDYRFIEVNDTFEHYTGWKRNEITGLTPLKIKLWVDTNQRMIFIEQLRREGSVRNMELVFRRKDGEQWTALVTSELIDLDGEPCALSLIADITEAKRAEEAKHESEQRFRLVANTAPVMIWMSGPDKLCTYVNQPWLDFTGNPLEAELGEGWTKGIHPDDLKQCLNTYEHAFDECRSFRMQYRIRRHDGEYRWLLDVGVPRFQADGSIAGYIGSCLDITERQLAEEALAGMGRKLIQAHEEERSWVARELHDDINQRIALISIELEQWLQQQTESGFPIDDQIRKLRVNLSELGKDVQDLSHRLHSSKLDYLGLTVAARAFCSELSAKHKVEIEFIESTVPRGIPKDTSLSLFRVLQEALQNAVKHSGVRYFKVDLRGTAGEVQLTVSDLGKGFDPRDAMAHQGLGLISMRERLQLVGGNLSIRSEPGEGTVVNGRVPVRHEQHGSLAAG
jgi:PAS domain S-box-containing protein